LKCGRFLSGRCDETLNCATPRRERETSLLPQADALRHPRERSVRWAENRRSKATLRIADVIDRRHAARYWELAKLQFDR